MIDFGIARALDSVRLTISGVTMGSPECMTPEQVRGLAVTPAADVFALGSLGAYALHGRSPFDAPNSAAMMFRVAHQAPDLDDFPAELRAMLESCLAKDPGDRPSPAEVLDFCPTRIPDEPAVFPRSWRPDVDGSATDPVRAEWLNVPEDVQPASGNAPLVPDGEPAASGNSWDCPVDGWAIRAAAADTNLSAHPTPTAVPVPVPELEPQPISVTEPTPTRPVTTWLMYGAAALTIVALITGLATLPSLRR